MSYNSRDRKKCEIWKQKRERQDNIDRQGKVRKYNTDSKTKETNIKEIKEKKKKCSQKR